MPPEIYLCVDDDEEEKRENAVDDHVGVSQVNLDLGRSSILEFTHLPILKHFSCFL